MPLRYWSFVILTLLLAALVGIVTYRTAQLLRHWKPDRNLLLLPSENITRLALIGVCISLGMLSGLPPQQLGWTLMTWPQAVAGGLVWGLAMAIGFYLATDWVARRSGDAYYSRIVLDAILPRSRRELWLTYLAMLGVVAAEELLFRSLLLGGLRPILPTWLLLAGTSVGFGVLHLPQGRWGVIGATVAGAILGLVFLVSGTLLAPAVAHYIHNMVQILQAVRMERTPSDLDG